MKTDELYPQTSLYKGYIHFPHRECITQSHPGLSSHTSVRHLPSVAPAWKDVRNGVIELYSEELS